MKVHVVGAGLAGLSAATALSKRGVQVEVSEASARPGGRCRSYYDPQIGLTIDNGNHLVLSGNQAVGEYLGRLGALDRLAGPPVACFPFVDMASGERWTLRPNAGALAWWILAPGRGVPGARLRDYLRLAPLLLDAPRGRRVDEVIACRGPAWERLMAPFLLAALNMAPEAGAAELAARTVRETLVRGGAAYAPRVPTPTLAAAFVEPAEVFLRARGVRLRTQRRLIGLRCSGDLVTGLEFTDGLETLAPWDDVILAVPAPVAAHLLPELTAPNVFVAIANAHFRAPHPPDAPLITGVLGATAQWIFAFEDRISVTVSGANRLMGESRETLARQLWAETSSVLGLPPALPPWQVVKERRATFEASVEQQRRRPGARTRYANLFLAGDWTDTGLPATIEGALRSGSLAAGLAVKGHRE
jgi:squalene-associated FAD-dependent desaturase